MNEAMRNVAVLLWALCAINSNSYARANQRVISEEAMRKPQTVIYGASRKAPGEPDEFVVEQAADAPNPLGNPIVSDENSDAAPTENKNKTTVNETNRSAAPQNVVQETLPQNPPISAQDSPQTVNDQIQNTLYKSGDRIYDVQSYPAKDINTISEPNVNPTINSYPSY